MWEIQGGSEWGFDEISARETAKRSGADWEQPQAEYGELEWSWAKNGGYCSDQEYLQIDLRASKGSIEMIE